MTAIRRFPQDFYAACSAGSVVVADPNQRRGKKFISAKEKTWMRKAIA
jgi:hypothetical protein